MSTQKTTTYNLDTKLKILEFIPKPNVPDTLLSHSSLPIWYSYVFAQDINQNRYTLQNTLINVFTPEQEGSLSIESQKAVIVMLKFIDKTREDNFAIRWAAIKGWTEIVKYLLEDEKVDPSANNNEALKQATKEGFIDIVKLLLKDKRLKLPEEDAEAIFYQCVHRGRLEICKLLLEDNRFDPFAAPFFFQSVLRRPQPEIALELMKDARIKNMLMQQNIFAWLIDPMHSHVSDEKNRVKIIRRILEETNLYLPENKSQILKEALSLGFDSSFICLLKNDRFQPYEGILVDACYHGRKNAVEFLLNDKNIDPSIKHNQALCIAIKKGYPEIVELLLSDKRVSLPEEFFFIAVKHVLDGKTQMLKCLLKDPRVNPKQVTEAFRRVTGFTYGKEAALLLLHDKRFDRNADFSEELEWLELQGEKELVKLLKNLNGA